MAMDLLKYKRVLVVDDEPDVLETLEEVLPMCDVVKAKSFEEAKKIWYQLEKGGQRFLEKI